LRTVRNVLSQIDCVLVLIEAAERELTSGLNSFGVRHNAKRIELLIGDVTEFLSWAPYLKIMYCVLNKKDLLKICISYISCFHML
jgi:hypothetical protein